MFHIFHSGGNDAPSYEPTHLEKCGQLILQKMSRKSCENMFQQKGHDCNIPSDNIQPAAQPAVQLPVQLAVRLSGLIAPLPASVCLFASKSSPEGWDRGVRMASWPGSNGRHRVREQRKSPACDQRAVSVVSALTRSQSKNEFGM